MGGTRRLEQGRLAEKLSKKSHFYKVEVETLLQLLKKFQGETTQKPGLKTSGSINRLDRTKFRDLLHNEFCITDDMLMDRVFRAFDKDNDSFLNEEEWVMGLSTILKGTLEEKIQYCFEVYDLNNDGYISREEMFHLLKQSLVKQMSEEDPDEGIKDLVELTLKKMDHDHDSRLSYADFKTSVLEDPLLLEAFGPCLPSSDKRRAFMATFTDKVH